MSSIRLFILDSFARHGEMHGHQLRLLAEEEHVHLWTDITVGSIYGAMKRMASEGLLEEVRVERDGNFPARQIYAISESGQVLLGRLRHQQLTELSLKPDPFDLALARLDPTTLDDLPKVVERRVSDYRLRLSETGAANERALPYLSEGEKFALHHREFRLRAEIAWLEELVAALPTIIADETARLVDADHPANVTTIHHEIHQDKAPRNAT